MNYPWSEIPERRRAHRVPLVVAVKKTIGGKQFLCQSMDISPTGMSMCRAKDSLVDFSGPVTLEFSLPGCHDVIKVLGHVVRDAAEGRYRASAVVFRHVSPSLRHRIDCYLGRLAA